MPNTTMKATMIGGDNRNERSPVGLRSGGRSTPRIMIRTARSNPPIKLARKTTVMFRESALHDSQCKLPSPALSSRQLSRQKFADAPLGVIVRSPGHATTDKSDVPARSREFEMKKPIGGRCLADLPKDRSRQERVIDGAQEKRWAPDATQPAQ